MSKKTIKLLTFSKANSYGAMLQCYALSKVLKNMGYDVILLNIPLDKSDYGIIGNLSYKIGSLIFKQFQKKWLPPFSKLCKNPEELKNGAKEGDIYIVGSDQVWNPDLTKSKALLFFFNFLPDNIKRIAYAASFGTSIWLHKDIQSEVSECLSKFSAIGVRENSGVQICKNTFGVDSTQTLDPTLLLENYNEFRREITAKKKYLISFSLTKPTEEWNKLLMFISQQTQTIPFALAQKRHQKDIVNIPFVGIEQWVSYIAGSSFVVTNSFHGTVFAILHKKPFAVFPTYTNREERIISLLISLGLEERYYSSVEKFYITDSWKNEIDYDAVYVKLVALREKSFLFLQNVL
jgi:hypothetical protein